MLCCCIVTSVTLNLSQKRCITMVPFWQEIWGPFQSQQPRIHWSSSVLDTTFKSIELQLCVLFSCFLLEFVNQTLEEIMVSGIKQNIWDIFIQYNKTYPFINAIEHDVFDQQKHAYQARVKGVRDNDGPSLATAMKIPARAHWLNSKWNSPCLL